MTHAHSRLKQGLLVSAAVLAAMTASAAASAQTTGGDIETIVVTAEKKTENIQNVPISMSAVSTEQLESINATDLTDLATQVPGMQVFTQTGQPGSAAVELRGISTGNLNSSTVAILVDDVPVGSSSSYASAGEIGVDLLPYDLDHVEVLEGPQGTLYGASSLGGLIKYVTPTPDLNTFSAGVGGGIFGIDHSSQIGSSERAVVNIPLVADTLAINASVGQSFRPGYLDNLGLDQKDSNHGTQYAGRVTLLWKPTERLTAQVMVLLNRSDFDGVGTIQYNPATGRPLYGYYNTSSFEPYGDATRTDFYSGRISYAFDWATVTSITGYSHAYFAEHYDLTPEVVAIGIPGVIAPGYSNLTTNKFTEELRIASPTDQRFQWLLGGFYTSEDSSSNELDLAIDESTGLQDPYLSPLFNSMTPSRLKEEAVFGNASYDITPDWDIGAGLRYSANQQTASGVEDGVVVGGNLTLGPYPSSDSSVTYSVDSRYRFTPNAMVYGRIASGYSPGGSNASAIGPDVPSSFGPDKLTNYEVGIKSQFFDNRLLFDLTAFYLDWTDIQIQERTPLGVSYTGNGGNAASKGLELTSSYALTPELRVGLNGAYTDATLSDDAPALGAHKGDPLPYAPKWSGALTADWTHPLVDDYALRLGAAWRYTGSRNTNFPDALTDEAHFGSYDALDVTAGVENDVWKANLYVKNLTNEKAYLSYSIYGAQILQPFTVGINFDIRFH